MWIDGSSGQIVIWCPTDRATGHQKSARQTAIPGMVRCRGIVRRANANNRLAGVYREPATDAMAEAFIRGDIAAIDMIPLLKAQAGPR